MENDLCQGSTAVQQLLIDYDLDNLKGRDGFGKGLFSLCSYVSGTSELERRHLHHAARVSYLSTCSDGANAVLQHSLDTAKA